ncbi:plant-specific domain TIGR01615 family protein [Hordeum vulgare]|nr:plant-specific domain TIGR01615 family protein [Hordeum vulgare]
MMLVAKEFGALSSPGAVVEAAQRRWAPPSTARVSSRDGSPVAVGDLWLRTREGGDVPGSASQHGSQESDMDLAMLVSDFLEGGGGGGGDSRGSSDGEPGGLHDLAHLADKIPIVIFTLIQYVVDFRSVISHSHIFLLP